jgi:hypothetical protein
LDGSPLPQTRQPKVAWPVSTKTQTEAERGVLLDAVIRLYQMTAPMSDFCALSEQKRIFNIHAKVANGVLDLGVSKKDLNCAEVTRRFVNH